MRQAEVRTPPGDSTLVGFNNEGQPPLVGFLRRDMFGRVFVDSCLTDEEHLTKITDGINRPTCRKYVEDLFPAGFDGMKVSVRVDVGISVIKEG